MSGKITADVRVRPVREADHDRWATLYEAYATFYEVEQTSADRDRVWGWITDPTHEVKALVVVDADDQPFGLAHYRPFARPLAAATGCYLDDLFIDPGHRGSGGVDLLLTELRRISRERGWGVIRWITAENNYRARSVYDRSATRTPWVTYDMDPSDPA
jgi:ribosomal protein S18 acetylase RimI-like enzyme